MQKERKKLKVLRNEKRRDFFRKKKYYPIFTGHFVPRFYARWSFNFFFIYSLYSCRYYIFSFLCCYLIWRFLKRRYRKFWVFIDAVSPYALRLYSRWKACTFTKKK